MKRCKWAQHPDMHEYHDKEWGVQLHEENKLFEFLILEGAQAGLSWNTILKKRPRYRKVFDGFNPKKVADYDEKKQEQLLDDPGIVRNKLKVKSAVKNAQVFLDIQKEFTSFDKYIWDFIDNKPIVNHVKTHEDIPASTTLSDTISKDLKKRGMSFVGSTIIYAFMRATGMVNDHEMSCPRYKECQVG